MGVTHLSQIAGDLIAAGRSGDTPAAVIRWGTYEAQQTITGTLSTISDQAKRFGIRPPAVIVVGEVVKMRERLSWFEDSFRGSALEEQSLAVTAAR
jgi:siroheme synthase